MIVCHTCYQKNSLITHGNHDVIDEDGETQFFFTQSTCMFCNTIHEIWQPIDNKNKKGIHNDV